MTDYDQIRYNYHSIINHYTTREFTQIKLAEQFGISVEQVRMVLQSDNFHHTIHYFDGTIKPYHVYYPVSFFEDFTFLDKTL